MIFVCALAYLTAFILTLWLNDRKSTAMTAALAEGCLFFFAAMAYFADYKSASESTEPLLLMISGAIGSLAWLSIRRRRGTREQRNCLYALVTTITLVMVTACFFGPSRSSTYFYRGNLRWTGPWRDPNQYGALMGVGIVLALGIAFLPVGVADSRGRFAKIRCARFGFGVAMAALLSIGIWHSYSRGAWLGALMGISYLAVKACSTRRVLLNFIRSYDWRYFLCISISVFVILGLRFRHSNSPVIKRLVSLIELNDFSSRNRLVAWDAQLQMMMEKPLLGFGWAKADLWYAEYYSSFKFGPTAGLRTNDYFALGTRLGIPAVCCLWASIWLVLKANTERHWDGRLPLHVGEEIGSLKTACISGAIVLAISFWFDGGLFKFATSALFWTLLNAGCVESKDK